MIALPAQPRILVVALRRIGDVLLTTPLVRSLRRAWPTAKLDMLVFADTAGILQGNPDIDHVIAMPVKRSPGASLALAARIARRYDLAISTQSGDRPTMFAVIAGRKSIAPLEGDGAMSVVKRSAVSSGVPVTPGLHRVEEMLRLADAAGVVRVGEVVCPAGDVPARSPASKPYAVIHPAPMFRYKQWHADGWRTVAKELSGRGFEIVVTGGPAAGERAYLDTVLGDVPVERADGKLSWPQLAALLAQARVFVGPDTSVTHLAASAGAPTVALFGPTDPRLWGPWPAGGLQTPWDAVGSVQQRGNVWLVQNPQPCMPCQQEGCDRHIGSYSLCLDEMRPAQVMAAIERALQGTAGGSAISPGVVVEKFAP
jgi:heptosyltransferase-3